MSQPRRVPLKPKKRSSCESLQRAIWESSTDAILTLNALGCIEDMNESAGRLLGPVRGRFLGDVLADGSPGWAELRVSCAGARRELRSKTAQGREILLDLIRVPLKGDLYVATLRELGGLEGVPGELERRSHLYLVLSQISELVVRLPAPARLYAAVCEIAVARQLFRMAAILGLDAESGLVRPLAYSGVVDDHFSKFYVDMADPKTNRGTIATAIRTGLPDICNDPVRDPRMKFWHGNFLKHKYLSTASFPLFTEGKTTGAFVLFASEPDYFDDEKVGLLSAVAKNVSFAIEAYAREGRRQKAEAALRGSEAHMALAQKIAHFGSWELDIASVEDFNSNALRWSKEISRLFQVPASLFKMTYGDFVAAVHVKDRARLAEAQQRLLDGGPRLDIEHRIVRPGGEIRWIHNIIEAEQNEAGQPTKLTGTVMDITERKKAEDQRDRAEDESRRAAESLAGIVKVQQELALSKASAQDMMELIAERALALTGGDGSVVETIEEKDIVYRACRGAVSHQVGLRIKKEGNLSSRVIEAGTALWSEDTEADSRVDVEATRRIGARSIVLVPLRNAQGVAGLLKVMWKQPFAFCQREVNNLQILGETLGLFIQRQQDADALLASEAEFRTLAEAMPQLVWTTRPDGWITYYNKQWSIYTGLRADEPWTRPFHPEDLKRSRNAYREAMLQNEPFTIECRLRRADGQYRWWLARAVPMRAEDGTVVRWFGTSTDIHDLKLAELEVKRTNRALKMLSGCNEALVRAHDEHSLLQAVCQIAVELGGYDTAWIGYAQDDPDKSVTGEAGAGEGATFLTKAQISWHPTRERGQGPVGWTLRGCEVVVVPDFEDGVEPAPWLAECSALGFKSLVCLPLLNEGRAFGTLVLMSNRPSDPLPDELDLLQELTKNLAFGIFSFRERAERKQLEQQFLRAQRMESIGTLAGGIAHDLNNALTPIIMSIDLLSMIHPDPESQELYSTISGSARRGADMVRQVLSFARGVEGQRMAVDLAQIVRDVEKIANETFLKHISVGLRIDGSLWKTLGDPTQLHQVLLNLCVNARDAMPHGGSLRLSASNLHFDEPQRGLHPDAAAGDYVLLTVEDTGSGMSEEVIDKIFEPFFTTKEVGKGTGLGLSTSMAIVKSHGGFLRATSQIGVGSVFEAYLPALREPSKAAPVLETVPASTPRGSGQCVLVVDDESSVRIVTKQTLEAYGYQVLVAGDGELALELYTNHKEEIAAVLTDMTMPNMDGPAMVKALRNQGCQIPILAASGLVADIGATTFPMGGVQRFLAKPYSTEALLNTLQEVLAIVQN